MNGVQLLKSDEGHKALRQSVCRKPEGARGVSYLVMDVVVRVFRPLRGEAVVRSSTGACVIGYTRQSSIGPLDERGAFLQRRSSYRLQLPCACVRVCVVYSYRC